MTDRLFIAAARAVTPKSLLDLGKFNKFYFEMCIEMDLENVYILTGENLLAILTSYIGQLVHTVGCVRIWKGGGWGYRYFDEFHFIREHEIWLRSNL